MDSLPLTGRCGRAAAIEVRRRRVLEQAYAAHPDRLKGRALIPPALSEIVDINLPQTQSTETTDDLTAALVLLANSGNQASQNH